MSKEPLITRSELRRRREAEERRQAELAEEQEQYREESYHQPEPEVDSIYRKSNKKVKPLNKTRSGEQMKMRERNTFLNKAILVVIVFIIIVALLVFFV
ncbi:cytoskeletal protein RodZ [Enterococcus sp. PF1-24]|uniref:cell wall synthase accessory phosphoprotein MacP n=1 Tax=unclassified Enterococcus TaxID=2608891 RepID=UPI002473D2FD|nr:MULTISPECIES: cell wall synthase accessory phosphoprotein MacP [unclassified Enterococcus]MDH6365076.1 cytoskeletal protein RodZ [Enterococcus sp. PFB1-1]MDH6402151.1 cytoskeletal protein RodZ [Enterococcus sp. PF1-24]